MVGVLVGKRVGVSVFPISTVFEGGEVKVGEIEGVGFLQLLNNPKIIKAAIVYQKSDTLLFTVTSFPKLVLHVAADPI